MSALALGAGGRRQWAGAAWVAAIFVKWIAIVFLPLRALEAHARGRRVGHVGFAIAALVVVAAASAQFGWHWLGAFEPLARNAGKETQFALPHRLMELGVPHDVALGLFAGAFALAYLWLARQAWRGRARLGLAAGLLLCASPYLVPWYAVWAVPVAAAEDDPPAQCSANESRFRTPSAAGRLRRRPRRRRAGSGDRDGAAGFFRVRLACRCGRRATAFARRR